MMNNKICHCICGILLLGILTACTEKKEPVRQLKSEADLSGVILTTSAGTYYDQKYSGRDDLTLFRVNTEADAIQALRQGKADVFVTDEVALNKEAQERLNVSLAFLGEEFFDVAFAVRKGNEVLLEQMNRFLAASKADGSLDAVISHWLHGTPAPEFPSQALESSTSALRCITATNLEPVCFLADGGEWQGMDADILRRFSIWSGRPFEMKFQDFGSAIVALSTGQCDIVTACLFITEERKKSVDFTIPYYKCHPGYFVRNTEQKTNLSLTERLKMNLITERRWKLITDGLLETLKITLLSILLGTILGAGICACRRSSRKWLRSLAGLYGDFINGMPTLVLLLIMFYVIFAQTGLDASTVAIITFALCFASSAGSIFDTAISSVPVGQTEAGLSLGFTPFKTFTGIVFPQALQKGLSLYTGECVSLLKSTSIVGYIAIQDLTRASDLIRSRTFDALVPLLVVTILYFALAWVIRFVLNLFLKKK